MPWLDHGIHSVTVIGCLHQAMALSPVVMPGLDPGIHSVTLVSSGTVTEWIAGSSPAMTTLVVY